MSAKTKILRAKHSEPGDFRLNYILLPLGFSYNSEFLTAKKGDTLRIFDGGDYPIFSVRTVKIHSAAADILSRMRYGVTIKRVLQIWQSNARLEGHSSKVISEDECLWVIYDLNPVQV